MRKDGLRMQIPCSYCGAVANPLNGIDRIDNQVGYEISNCRSCCTKCNVMKMDSSAKDFVRKCTEIANFAKNIQL